VVVVVGLTRMWATRVVVAMGVMVEVMVLGQELAETVQLTLVVVEVVVNVLLAWVVMVALVLLY
jgi:hypothetical protein